MFSSFGLSHILFFICVAKARDFSLGTSFPVIHDLKLNSYELDKEKKIIQVRICKTKFRKTCIFASCANGPQFFLN